MNNIEEIVELKKKMRIFKIYIIIGIILAIPSLILAFQILQETATTRNIILYFALLILILPAFISFWYKFNKQYENAEKAFFKNTLLKIGREEFINEETKEELCIKIKQYLDNDQISNVDSILKLNVNYKIINFFSYDISEDEYEFNSYNGMILELSKEDEFEKYQKIISQKNNTYNFNYSLTTFHNKLIISVLIDTGIDILYDFSNPIAEFFKEILLEKI